MCVYCSPAFHTLRSHFSRFHLLRSAFQFGDDGPKTGICRPSVWCILTPSRAVRPQTPAVRPSWNVSGGDRSDESRRWQTKHLCIGGGWDNGRFEEYDPSDAPGVTAVGSRSPGDWDQGQLRQPQGHHVCEYFNCLLSKGLAHDDRRITSVCHCRPSSRWNFEFPILGIP
ncbi:uncharacterized protein BO95DRAFT_114382 [Aspergillus brunneoviolaceus CBS 621.78]|uniref:Uncharacterized protein n=1 Tax=Aspergillus brunneoviolaceus CBS 621.78 TaxID=1450534 RepID=A0ACD1GNV6_9EURO|nr:hypothetical protein BO95DRAFT_114382 [Aspergillus brunneoviolaceus CBS 621.78]RAH50808.1 hypothetical protein BO95DRAFT_114382 [Aspergillus brunneoviolaceus CBS 621.78]